MAGEGNIVFSHHPLTKKIEGREVSKKKKVGLKKKKANNFRQCTFYFPISK